MRKLTRVMVLIWALLGLVSPVGIVGQTPTIQPQAQATPAQKPVEIRTSCFCPVVPVASQAIAPAAASIRASVKKGRRAKHRRHASRRYLAARKLRRLRRQIRSLDIPREVTLKVGEEKELTLTAVNKKGKRVPVVVRALVADFKTVSLKRKDNTTMIAKGEKEGPQIVKVWVPGTRWVGDVKIIVQKNDLAQNKAGSKPSPTPTPSAPVTGQTSSWDYYYSKAFGRELRSRLYLGVIVLLLLIIFRKPLIRRVRRNRSGRRGSPTSIAS